MSADVERMPTVREAIVIKAIAAGVKESDAIRMGGWGSWGASHHPQWLRDHPAVAAQLATLRDEILFDAAEVLRELIRQYAGLIVQEARLEAMLGHDIGDLYDESGALKSVATWPEVWRKQLVVEIQTKEEFGRSTDGKDGEKRGGWDKSADIKNVKRESTLAIERELRACKKQQVECLEVMSTHRAVDAKAAVRQDLDVTITVTAEDQRKLAAAEKRMRRVIDVTPDKTVNDPA